jgi:hypothetical protein
MAVGHWLEATADRLRFKPTAIGHPAAIGYWFEANGRSSLLQANSHRPTAIGPREMKP